MCGVVACGGDPVTAPDVSEDMRADEVADVRPDASSPDASADSSLDSPQDATLTMTLTPVEWGLGAQPVDASATRQVALTREAGATTYSATTLWPAGVWQVRVESGDGQWGVESDTLTGLARAQDALKPWSALSRPAPMLSLVDESVRVQVDLDTPAFTLTRTVDAPALVRLDSTATAHAGVGEAVDEALEQHRRGQLDDEQIASELSARVHALGGGPIESSRGAFFFSHERTEVAPQVRGTMTQWEARAEGTMRRVTGKLWGRFMRVGQGPQAYKLVYGQGSSWRTDPTTRHVQWDGLAKDGVGDFNSILAPTSTTTGRTVWWPSFASPQLGNARAVYVHLPPGYDASGEALHPTLYVQDGNESITRAQFHEVADAWSQREGNGGVVMVFVALASQEDRMREYTMATQDSQGDAYTDFLANTLVPAVEEHVRAQPSARGRGVLGASLGGLISFWAALRHPTVFEYTGGMSSSFFWAQDFMLTQVQARGCQGLRYYIDSGEPRDNADVTRLMRDVLTERGCTFEHIEQPNGRHEWSFWKARLPNALRMFYDGSLDSPSL